MKFGKWINQFLNSDLKRTSRNWLEQKLKVVLTLSANIPFSPSSNNKNSL